MSKIINEELYRMKYLFGYQRGVVISEQDDDPFLTNELKRFDWNGKKKGLIDLTNSSGMYAFNVGYENGRYVLSSASKAIRLTSGGNQTLGGTPPKIDNEPKLSSLNLQGSSFPYPDNMVQPKFESFPEAKKVYDSFIQSIVDFLKVAHFTKMGTFTIQGTADSARPTLGVPKGYAKLDHPGELYDGKTDPNEMNQYLADTRAKELGKLIVQNVLDKTGINISSIIKYIDGINYYGQEGKRGTEFKNVTVTPSTESVTITEPSTQTVTGGTQTSSSSSQSPGVVETLFDLSPWGGGKIPMKRLEDANYVVPFKYLKSKGLYMPDGSGIFHDWDVDGIDGQTEVNAKIVDGEFFAKDISFGKFISTSEQEAEYDYKAEATTKFVTSGRPMIVGGRDGNAIIRIIRFTLSTRRR